MGNGPSVKETTLHHARDPLLEAAVSDEEVDLLGVMLFGASDRWDRKALVARRAAVWAQGMRADGAIVSTDGWGNTQIDHAEACAELVRRGLSVVGMLPMGRQGRPVVDGAGPVIDFHESASGRETNVVGENTLTDLHCRKAMAMLKLQMRRRGQGG
ncbi:MAG: hypothetical protein IJR14_05705 [Synergistaceae bacterium]|nr:hypothetical protein [Synergistaceae bacterium]